MPAATASSTTYWIPGLSTRGIISFGVDFVAGRKRVPSPAAGMTALRTRMGSTVRRPPRVVTATDRCSCNHRLTTSPHAHRGRPRHHAP